MKSGFLCEHCGSFHETAERADECEALHFPITETVIVGARFDRPEKNSTGAPADPHHTSKYPTQITVQFGDWFQVFDRTRGYTVKVSDQRR